MQLDPTTLGIILAVVGIAVSAYFGLRKSKSKSQHQITKDKSVAIQSGRDTKINDR